MPVTSEQVEALLARCKAFIDEGRNPVACITGEEHETLQALHNENVAGAAVVLAQLRDHAEHNSVRPWSAHNARRLSFSHYVEQARVLRDAMETARRDSNVVLLAERRMANAPRQQGRSSLAELEPAIMVTMASPRLRAIGLLRLHRAGRIWFDTFANQSKTDWNGTDDGATVSERQMNDEFYLNVAVWLAQQDEKLGGISVKPLVIDCCHTAALADKRNAPRDYLNGLVWDGVERLRDVFSRGYGADQSEFNMAAGRCWFVGMIARIMRPGCQLDTMPVLIGRQGIFKSQSLRVIGGDWYRAAQSSIHHKDFLQELWGALVLEIPELHSFVTSNASAAKAKSVISIQVDHFRKSYGYAPDEYRRTVVMVGTTNNHDWHHDESGEARRFWPIHCGVIDIEWIRESRNQLFAEALAYFNLPADSDGATDPRSQWWNVPRLAQRDLMDAESGEDAWTNMITAQLDRMDANAPKIFGRDSETMTHWDGTLSESTDWGNLLTVQRIALQWLRLTTDQAGKRITANRIGAIMRHLGWHRVQQRMHGTDRRVRVWLPTSNEIVAREMPIAEDVPIVVPDEEDIPF